MKINLKHGIDKLIFGMLKSDVVALYGKPSKEYIDEDNNTILVYNIFKMRLTFYKEEQNKLGYIVASSSNLTLNGKPILGKSISNLKKELSEIKITQFTEETFDTFVNYFNEEHWLLLQTEFEEVIKVEVGAIINSKDEFDWKFKK
jgi:hypothetical protein